MEDSVALALVADNKAKSANAGSDRRKERSRVAFLSRTRATLRLLYIITFIFQSFIVTFIALLRYS